MLDPFLMFENPESYISWMTSHDVEGQYFDRKEVRIHNGKIDDTKDSIVKTVSAFANSRGGLLVLGIADNGTIIGIDHLNEEQRNSLVSVYNQRLVNQSARSKQWQYQNKTLLLIYVPEGTSGICETTGSKVEAWKREMANSWPLTTTARETLIIERSKKFEQLPICEYDFLLIHKTVYELFKKAQIERYEASFQSDDAFFLQNIGACRKENGILKFTNAGYLFFANNPRSYIPSAYIRFLKYECEIKDFANPGTCIFDKDFDGCLPEILRKIRAFVFESPYFRRYSYRNPQGSGIIEENEYPLHAVEEAIVNAIIHRDYQSNDPIVCTAYRDAFIVKSPGRFNQPDYVPNEFDLGTIDLFSTPRNRTIVDWIRSIKDESGRDFVKSLAEGTRTILESTIQMGLPAPRYKTNGYTLVTFYNNYKVREAKYHAFSKQLTNESCNLFRINIFNKNENSTSYPLREVKEQIFKLLKDKLQNSGWFIDSEFGHRIVAHPKGNYIELNHLASKFIQIFSAYTFLIYQMGMDLYLSVDYDIQVKSICKLKNLIPLNIIDFRHKRAIAKYGGNIWHSGEIEDSTEFYARVRLFELERTEDIKTDDIIPRLSNKEIKGVLRGMGVYFDLDKKVKEYSLASSLNSSKERYGKINEIIKVISREIFPLSYNGYIAQVSEMPTNLQEANPQLPDSIIQPFSLYKLEEPKVQFNGNGVEDKIASGLSKYGAYSLTPKDIEIIPFCLFGYEEKMQQLLAVLQTGSNTFKGMERTFGTHIKYTSIISKNNADDFLQEIERLLLQNPSWEGDLNRIFLIHVPEDQYDIFDINSPYFSLKEFLLEKGVPVQMIDSDTLDNHNFKDLNLALNIVAKTGSIPWVLHSKLPDADIFIGLSYAQYKTNEQIYRTMGYANVFNSYGQWTYYKGNAQAFNFHEKGKYFYQLVKDTLTALQNTLNESPSIYIHYSDKFSKDDKEQILKAVQLIRPKATVTFVWLNTGHNIRMFDGRVEGNGSLARGSYVTTTPKQFYLSTTGYNILRKIVGTPVMIEVNSNIEPYKEGQIIPFRTIAQHLLALTKLNWASSQSVNSEPVTIKYARDIAKLSKVFLQRKGTFKLHKALEKTPWFI